MDIKELLDSNFWFLSGLVLIAYYAWVVFSFFRLPIQEFFAQNRNRSETSSKSITWDELAFSLSIQRKLLENKYSELDEFEKELLQRSPFKEFIANGVKK